MVTYTAALGGMFKHCFKCPLCTVEADTVNRDFLFNQIIC